ncbi:MAG: class I SAM-dependent methyltransferase [Pirellulales bacterium]|nr:class I SAM-dependent methyltransferase [Pirellulales bacterium]
MSESRHTQTRLQHIENWDTEFEIVAGHVRRTASEEQTLNILEAGCGCAWDLDLQDVPYKLTGVDVDEDALRIRTEQRKDLDVAVVGDLRTVELAESHYDVIYNSYVLEHIPDAERVLDNFWRWLKPGGLLVLRVPDRNSVYGFLTRITPLWVHILYKRFVVGFREAGQPGVGPFPTVYDRVVSRGGIRRWCRRRGLAVRAEYGSNYYVNEVGVFSFPIRALVRLLHVCSFGRLAYDHSNLTYVLQKPPAAASQHGAPLRSEGVCC